MSAAVLTNAFPIDTPIDATRRGSSLSRRTRLARTLVVLSLSILIAAGYAMSAGAGSQDSPSQKYVTVTVAGGETFWSIASQFKSGNTQALVDQIQEVNGLKSVDVEAGARIRIPINN